MNRAMTRRKIKSSPPLVLKIDSDPANLSRVRVAIEKFCAAHDFEKQACDDIGLCVNEALANVMRHAYDGATDRPIEVSAEPVDERMVVKIRDWGKGVVPEIRPRSDCDLLRPGGLGLICLGTMMDEVKFDPQDDGMLLTLVRRRNS